MAESKGPTHPSIHVLVNYNPNLAKPANLATPSNLAPQANYQVDKNSPVPYYALKFMNKKPLPDKGFAYVLVGEYENITYEIRETLIKQFNRYFYAKEFGYLTFAHNAIVDGYEVLRKSSDVSFSITGDLANHIRNFREIYAKKFEEFRVNSNLVELYTYAEYETKFGTMYPEIHFEYCE